MAERNAFHVIVDSCYENIDRNNSHLDEIDRVRKALDTGKTVIVKDLELWGGPITEACNALGKQVTAHMYISPANGTKFEYHTDDTDVVIALLHGTKFFEFQGHGMKRMLTAGQMLPIPMNKFHRADPRNSWSCHISFGIPETYIGDNTHSYPVTINALNNLLPQPATSGLQYNLSTAIIC